MSSHCQNQPNFLESVIVNEKDKQMMPQTVDKFDSLFSSTLFSSSAPGLANFQTRSSRGITELPKSSINTLKILY